ncbi:MAG: hypothetical protein ABR923_12500 [Terracidiphilus sp.]
MADETKVEGKKGSLLSQILVPAVIALIAGGSSPWWFNALSHKSTPNPTPAVTTPNAQQPAMIQPEPPKAPVVSREFFLGRWRAEQDNAYGIGVHSVNTITYFDNGRFEGNALMANSYGGRNVSESGNWEFVKLSDQSFRLFIKGDNGYQIKADFTIIDQDHIHNIGDNYIAERVK